MKKLLATVLSASLAMVIGMGLVGCTPSNTTKDKDKTTKDKDKAPEVKDKDKTPEVKDKDKAPEVKDKK